MNSNHCLNCDQTVTQSQNFCANCGQPTPVHRFTTKHFLHEGFHAFTHADKGLFNLLKELLIRPGVVAREYIAGKRKKYFNPFTFFLILAAFYVFAGSLKMASTHELDQTIPVQIIQIKNPVAKQQAIDTYKRGMKAKLFMTKYSNTVAMVAVPFFALLFWLIYYRKKYNYAEHLLANLLFVSFANLAFSVIVFPLQALLNGRHLEWMIFLLGFILQWIYFVLAYGSFIEANSFWPRLKVIVSVLFGLILWFFLTLSMMGLYIYQNAHFLEIFKYMRQ
jgi:hypothetical protein